MLLMLLLLLTLLLSRQGSIHARAETRVTVPLAPWSVGGVGGVRARPRPIAASRGGQRSKQLMAGGVCLNGGSGRGTHIGSSPRSAWNVTVVASAWTVWQFVLQLIGGRLASAAGPAVETGLRVGRRENQAEEGK